MRTVPIGIVIPAHDEADHIGECLESIERAAEHARGAGHGVHVLVICDACSDGTPRIAISHGADVIEIDARNVGQARMVGADAAIAAGAAWLSFTDADTIVSEAWLIDQIALEVDAVCGTVEVASWTKHHPLARAAFQANYNDREGHRHIHGANLGIATAAYRRAGGFGAHRCHEDVYLVAALERSGARVAWSSRPRVLTSARRDCRIEGGFGSSVAQLSDRLHAVAPIQPLRLAYAPSSAGF